MIEASDEIERLRLAVAQCRTCAVHLPNPPRPLTAFSSTAKVVIIGQAPGRLAHESGVPWNDPSGQRLRDWLVVDDEIFYDPDRIALMPMGFCFPGTGKSGDLPPRKECAPQWHEPISAILPVDHLTLLVGTDAQTAKLASGFGRGLEDRIRATFSSEENVLALPHPSWRVAGWMTRNPWFAEEVLPQLRARVAKALSTRGGAQ